MILRGVLGLACLLFFGYIMSKSKKDIKWLQILRLFVVQCAMAAFFLWFKHALFVFHKAQVFVEYLGKASNEGTSFVFGYLANSNETPFTVSHPESSFVFAFAVLPVLVFIGALGELLIYWGILPWVIRKVAFVFTYLFGIGETLGFALGLNLFFGQSETPIIMSNYLHRLTKFEMLCLMTIGMAGVSCGVMFLYITLLSPIFPANVGSAYIFEAILLSLPSSILFASLVEPETKQPTNGSDFHASTIQSGLDALIQGAMKGARVIPQVCIMLFLFVALVFFINNILQDVSHGTITLQLIMGYLFYPVAWLMGFPMPDIFNASHIIGIRLITNEIIAFKELITAPTLMMQSKIMLVFALCGFSNVSSIGIANAMYRSLVPERKSILESLVFKAFIISNFANFSSAIIMGLLVQ
jgi:concentrative nucleoside transporter, CNT family